MYPKRLHIDWLFNSRRLLYIKRRLHLQNKPKLITEYRIKVQLWLSLKQKLTPIITISDEDLIAKSGKEVVPRIFT
ncbi:hypothetical protein QW060_09740 [Myroides ceti]|uniref:Uncharacterized protein n=1 Tax=Paenimyroides ceti TaxID=395087 RepID=A0ABT8CW65_9FLAO|nr:hypothetical protein [Paenimyroides ceti]MDN3707410.1 hypothetical protein [Paenimyroides ceti]